MKKFMVLYKAPIGAVDEWMKQPEETRKAEEQKMQQEWTDWMTAHPGLATQAAGLGKTKKVEGDTVSDTRNDLMLYSIAEGESQEAVADAFKGHPHFGIPNATIEIIAINSLEGMQNA